MPNDEADGYQCCSLDFVPICFISPGQIQDLRAFVIRHWADILNASILANPASNTSMDVAKESRA
jgi:hypothetical protein